MVRYDLVLGGTQLLTVSHAGRLQRPWGDFNQHQIAATVSIALGVLVAASVEPVRASDVGIVTHCGEHLQDLSNRVVKLESNGL